MLKYRTHYNPYLRVEAGLALVDDEGAAEEAGTTQPLSRAPLGDPPPFVHPPRGPNVNPRVRGLT